MKSRPRQIRKGRVKRYVEGAGMIVVLEVPVTYAREDPDEPLLEMQTLKLLDEAQRRANAGDRRWLKKVGRIYEAGAA